MHQPSPPPLPPPALQGSCKAGNCREGGSCKAGKVLEGGSTRPPPPPPHLEEEACAVGARLDAAVGRGRKDPRVEKVQRQHLMGKRGEGGGDERVGACVMWLGGTGGRVAVTRCGRR